MSKKNKKPLVPKLRFPAFQNSEEWVKRPLSELLTENKQRNRDLKYSREQVLSVSGEYGCVNQIELLGRSYAGVSVKDYHVVETGDIVYTKSPLKQNPFGIIKENKGKPGVVSTLYAVYRVTDKGNSSYLDHYFSNDYNLNSYLQPIVRKGAKNDMKVNNFAVLGGEIFAPKPPEQQKIADCLTSLDELITVEANMLEAYKAHKKGLMQKLFPAEGKTVPEWRFPEFQGAGEWENCSLNDIAKITSGGTPSRTRKDCWNGSIPWITTTLIGFNTILKANEYITKIGLKESSAKIFPKNTILMAMYGQGITRGKVAILGIEAATNQACAALLLKKGFNSNFVFQNLAGRYEEIRDISNSGGQENLSAGLIEKISFSYPGITVSGIKEQQKIANCLTSIDELISAQTQKIDVLKIHKKGLVQGFFLSADEVGE